ncbi:MAG: NAD(P)H quinone oxidoreductase [Candidatus Binatia bacterium]|nr:MAG: NAD(P)H quinone oxidoreductase [Candidatus Binatia bacterium]
MKAVVCDRPGNEEVLRLADVAAPEIGPEDVRIRVFATSVNRADILQRQGLYPPPPGASSILGLECAGEIIELGERVSGWRLGDRVMALLAGGGYAEEVAVHYGSVLPVPSGLSWEEAGAFPEVFLTAFLNLFLLGQVPDRGRALVHGGGSGVGTAATTLLKLRGVQVFVTAGGEEKCRRCRQHGADVAIDYRSQDFAEVIHEATDGRGVHVVLDHIGAKYLDGNLRSLAHDGRLVVIGLMGGAKAEINLAPLLTRRLSVIGSTLRTRSVQDKARIVAAFREQFGADLEAGRIRPVIDSVFPLERVADAHRRVQSSEHFGKVVLRVRA